MTESIAKLQKSILITGATGFIGRVLVTALVNNGQRVICAVRNTNLIEFPPEVSIYRVSDICRETVWDTDMLSEVDVIYHLAGRAHVLDDRTKNPLTEYRKLNVDGTIALAEQAAAAGVKRFVFISSIGVNGATTNKEPFTERLPPNPYDIYAISKYEAEQQLQSVCESSDMEYVILRPPLVYGPGNPGNFLRLIKLVNTGLPLPFGGVRNQRSFIYLDNLVDALRVCGEHPEAANNIWLASDGEVVSTPQLLKEMGNRMGKTVRLFSVPVGLLRFIGKMTRRLREMEKLTGSLVVDDSLFRKRLGWCAPISLQDGLNATIDWYKTKT